MGIFDTNRTLRRLSEMLDDAINGNFEESRYDESELSRLESRWRAYLAHSSKSLKEVEREKENVKMLLSDISHQTKTPLANIMLYSELLKEGAYDSATENLVNEIYLQAEKLEFLIQALVKMSRLETNVLAVQPVRQSVRPLIEQAVRAVQAKAAEKSIGIQLPGVFPEAAYDLKWTTEALYNILDNAVKYSSIESGIALSVKAYEMYVRIDVKDAGRGIEEAETAAIFKRFYRGSGVWQEEGVGIGLYLAREIVRKEQGYIKVSSKVGEGSVFSIYLPVQ